MIFFYLRAAAPAADPGKIGPRVFDPPATFEFPSVVLFFLQLLQSIVPSIAILAGKYKPPNIQTDRI